MRRAIPLVLVLAVAAGALGHPSAAVAQDTAPAAPAPDDAEFVGDLMSAFTKAAEESSAEVATPLKVLAFFTVLAVLPSLLVMATSFTRIIIVLAILRQALGTQSTPNNQILIGLALFLTLFIMMPVIIEVNEVALQPYLAEQLNTLQALEAAEKIGTIPYELTCAVSKRVRRVWVGDS